MEKQIQLAMRKMQGRPRKRGKNAYVSDLGDMYKKINGEDASYVSRGAPDDIWDEMDDNRFNL